MTASATAVLASPLGRQLTTDQAAARLGVSVKHLRRLVETRKIEFLKEGGARSRVRIYEQWCDDYVERLRQPVGDVDVETVREASRQNSNVIGIADLLPRRRRFAKASAKSTLRVGRARMRSDGR